MRTTSKPCPSCGTSIRCCECPGAETLLRLLRDGGEVVSSALCSEPEIVQARALGWMWVDADGFGYVYREAAAMDERSVGKREL